MTFFRFTVCIVLSCSLAIPVLGDDAPQPIEPEAISLDRPVDYAQDVAPILEANCVACHNEIIDEGKLSLEDIVGMVKGGGRGPAIVPGKPEESLLMAVAAHRVEPIMPPVDNDAEAKPLTPRELGIIRQWILEGATKGQAPSAAMIAWKAIPSQLRAIHAVALSPQSRFVAVGRGNQIEVYDLALNQTVDRLTDPLLNAMTVGSAPLYPNGAAHQDLVHAVAFHPNGNLLASGGYRVAKLWERTGLGQSTPLNLGEVTALAISPDRTLAAVVVGPEVRMVKLADATVQSTRTLPTKPMLLAFSGDGQTLAAVCEDNSLNTWKAGTEESLRTIALPTPSRSVAFLDQRLVTAHDDGIIRVWSPEKNDSPEVVLPGHTGPVHVIKALPGQPNVVASAGEDGLLRIWDVNAGGQSRSMNHGAPIADIAASPDGKSVVSVGSDGAIRVWNSGDGSKIGEFVGLISRHRSAQQTATALEWRKQLVAVSDQRTKDAEAALKDREGIHAKAVEAKTAADTALAEAKKVSEEADAAAKAAADQLTAKPDDEALKKASEEATKKSAEAKAKLAPAEEAIRSAERSVELAEEALKNAKQRLEERQQQKAAAEEAAKSAEAANMTAASEAGQSPAAQRVAFAPDGLRLAACYADGTLQTFSATAQPLDFMPGPSTGLRHLAFSSETATLVVSASGDVQQVDVAGTWQHTATLGPSNGSPTDLSSSLLVDRVLALAFSPDGTKLATGGGEPSRSGDVIVWDVATRSPTKTIADAHSDTVSSVAFSRDGQRIASAGADKFAKVFDVASGDLIRSFEGHTDQVLGVALKADGTELATASSDLTVKIWDVETGEQRRTIPGFGKQVTSIRYVGLTSEVGTSSGDKVVRLHRTNDGGQVRTFGGASDFVHSIAVSDDGAMVIAGGEDGILFIWNGTNGEVIHRIEPSQPADSTTAAK